MEDNRKNATALHGAAKTANTPMCTDTDARGPDLVDELAGAIIKEISMYEGCGLIVKCAWHSQGLEINEDEDCRTAHTSSYNRYIR